MSAKRFYVCFAFLCLSCLYIASFHPAAASEKQDNFRLCLKDDGGNILYEKAVRNGTRFCIRYVHSVALSPVEDHFIIKHGSMILDRTVYQDFGAGLPHQPEGSQKMTLQDGKIVISGFDRKLGRFDLRVGRVAGHTLIFSCEPGFDPNGRMTIPLRELVEPGGVITFELTSLRDT